MYFDLKTAEKEADRFKKKGYGYARVITYYNVPGSTDWIKGGPNVYGYDLSLKEEMYLLECPHCFTTNKVYKSECKQIHSHLNYKCCTCGYIQRFDVDA